MTKYPDLNKAKYNKKYTPKHLKKISKEQVLRNRKILENCSFISGLLGFICIFLFSGTRIEYELPWWLLIVGFILVTLGYLGFKLLDETNRGNTR